VASGFGANHGILVKNGAVLETLSGIEHVVFDKTGTLTEGRISVSSLCTADERWTPGSGEEMPPLTPEMAGMLARLAAVERYSEHPVAGAVLGFARAMGVDIGQYEAANFQNRPGFGVKAEVEGISVMIGTPAWLDLHGVTRLARFDEIAGELDGLGVGSLRCAIDGREAALIGVEDRIRDDASSLVSTLKEAGMHLTLLSGDRRHTAETIAARLGGMEVIAEVLPEDKDRVIAGLQETGHRVVMVGDGVNDAPALVRADVGMALGSGTDVSIASADIVLISSELEKVWLAALLSRRTLRTIKQNIGISVLYNLIMVHLAMAAEVTPLVAAISMPVSSLLVIGNAARIRTLFKGTPLE
jgi:Cu2+-exporting ATPase